MQRCVVTGSEDGTAKVWTFDDKHVEWEADLATGETETESWEGHDAGITAISTAPNDLSTILTASKDGKAKIWKVDGTLRTTLEAQEVATKHRHPKGDNQASQSLHVGHTDFLNSAIWSKKGADAGALVATSSDDKTACVWDVEKGKLIGTLDGHAGPVSMVQWNNQSGTNTLLTCSHDGTCILFDGKNFKSLRTVPTAGRPEEGHSGPVWSAYFSMDDELMMTASKDGTVRVFDVRSGRLRTTLQGHGDAVLQAIFNPKDGNQVLSCSMDNTARLWDLRSNSVATVFDHHKACVWTAVFGSDPKSILTASHDMTALIYDQRLQLPKKALSGHTGLLWQASFSPDDHWAMTCSEDTTARVWNLRTGARRPPCHILRKGSVGHSDAVTCATWASLPESGGNA